MSLENFAALQEKMPAEPTKSTSPKATKSKLVRLADITLEKIEWFWHPYIPIGKLTIFEGEEGLGKSFLSYAIAAANSVGSELPNQNGEREAGNTLLLSAEDGIADTVKIRLASFEADQSKIFAVDEVFCLDEKGFIKLKNYIIEANASLVILDPLFAYLPRNIDTNSASHSRLISSKLSEIAAELDCAIIGVRHVGKSRGNGDARAAGLGSIDWRAAARSVLLVGVNPDMQHIRVVFHTKHNLSEKGKPFAFTIKKQVDDSAKFQWTDAGKCSVEMVLQNLDAQTRAEQNEAVDFLKTVLEKEAKTADEVKKQALGLGLSEQNLRTARAKLGIKPRKETEKFNGQWFWELPKDKTNDEN